MSTLFGSWNGPLYAYFMRQKLRNGTRARSLGNEYSCHTWKLEMSTARRRLKSPQSISGASAHPTMVMLVYIMVMDGWLTSFSFYVNWPSHSWYIAILDFDLEISTPGSRSWVWSNGKVIQSAQYHINSLRFHFTSIRPTIPEIELFRNFILKHPRSRSWGQMSRSHIVPSIQPMHFLFVSHQSDQPLLRYGQNSVWPWKYTSEFLRKKIAKITVSQSIYSDNNHD